MPSLIVTILSLVVLCSSLHAVSSFMFISKTYLSLRELNLASKLPIEYAKEWLSSKDIPTNDNKIELAPCTAVEYRRSSFYSKAKVSIAKNENILVLPQGLSLDIDRAEKKLGAFIDTSLLRTGSLGLLSLYLLSERAMGSASKYNSYIQSLPAVPPGVFGFSPEDRQLFLRSTTRDVQSQIDAVESDITYLTSSRTPLSSLIPPELLTRETLLWALGVVKDRCVYVDSGVPVLLPGMDYLEFDPLSELEPAVASAGIFGGKVHAYSLMMFYHASPLSNFASVLSNVCFR